MASERDERRPIKVTPAEAFRNPNEPPLRIGDVVRLNSGGPHMIVVDMSGDGVIVAWRGKGSAQEETFPRACLHRVHLGGDA